MLGEDRVIVPTRPAEELHAAAEWGERRFAVLRRRGGGLAERVEFEKEAAIQSERKWIHVRCGRRYLPFSAAVVMRRSRLEGCDDVASQSQFVSVESWERATYPR